MSNDKDFILKNAVEVGGPTNVTLGTVTSDNIDLSTGNYFKDTPTGNSTYSISNAGDVQSFQLEVTGGTAAVAQNFSTTLYTGTGDNQTKTVTNGLDLAGDGGMVWTKGRNIAYNNIIFDSERGLDTFLYTNTTDAQENQDARSNMSFNSNGYSFGSASSTSWGPINEGNYNFVSWAFKKAPKFFDVVTYTGNGSTQAVSHSLGTTVGTLIVKSTTGTENWVVYHRSLNVSNQEYLQLNLVSAVSTNGRYLFGDNSSMIAPTSTAFTVGLSAGTNENGQTYVAYLFAHDTAADSQIKCGSYTGTGNDLDVNLGWEPSFVIIKNHTNAYNWQMHDSIRGVSTGGGDAWLSPNLSNAENSTDDYLDFSATGFTVHGSTGGNVGANGHGYIYIAIRAASDPDITWPTSIEWAGGVAPSAPAVGETDVFTIATDDGGTTYTGVKTSDNLS